LTGCFPVVRGEYQPCATPLRIRYRWLEWPELTGHANIDTTLNIYTHVVDGSLRATVEKVGTKLFTIAQPQPGSSSLTP
jgi:hypothetical protein